MKISAKARLVSLIVALVFMAGTLIGTGTYLIINHINKANATTETTLSISGNLYNTDGTINTSAVTDFLNKLDFITDGAEYKSPDIADRAGVTATNSFIFQMGYYVSPSGVMDTSKPITWQAVYARNGYLTIWMANSYTSEYFNNGTSSNSGWKTSSNNYSQTGNYSNSLIREVTKNIYSKLAGKFTTLNAIIKSPSEAGATWQAKQQNAYYLSTSYWSITNGMQTNANSGSGKANANPNGWSWDSSVYSDKFWLPSHVEIFNTPDQTGAYKDRGLWGITSANDRKDTSSTALDGKSTSQYCWLRSGYSVTNTHAMLVNSSGSASYNYVNSSYGVRPAAHLSLSALQKAATAITLTENIYTTDGNINPDAVTTLLETVQYFGHEDDTNTYTAHQIASRNNTVGYNSDRTIVFPMGYVNGTSGESIYWRATYLHNNYLTIWMDKGYTNSTWNESSVTVNYTAYANSTIQNYLDNTLWSALTMGSGTLQSIFALPSNVGYQSTSTANTTYWYSSSYTATYNNLATAVATGSYLWLPSFGEVFNNTSSSYTSNTSTYTGQWGLNSTDRSFNTSNYDGTSTSYCWLRSGGSSLNRGAMRVDSSGSASCNSVYGSYGVRPAAHLDLDALNNLLPKNITITTNNPEYGQVFADGQIGESVTVNVAAGEQTPNLIVIPNAGYAFLYWENASTHEIFSELNPLSFEVTGDITLTAVFGKSVNGVAVSIAYQNTDGTISTSQDNIPLSAIGEARITGYTTLNGIDYVHFSAVAYTGYYFVGWQVDGEILKDPTTAQNYLSSANISYNLVQDKQVFAVFALISNLDDMNTETDNNQTTDFV